MSVEDRELVFEAICLLTKNRLRISPNLRRVIHFASLSLARLWHSEFSRHARRKQRLRFDLRSSRQLHCQSDCPKSETAITSAMSNKLRGDPTTVPSTL